MSVAISWAIKWNRPSVAVWSVFQNAVTYLISMILLTSLLRSIPRWCCLHCCCCFLEQGTLPRLLQLTQLFMIGECEATLVIVCPLNKILYSHCSNLPAVMGTWSWLGNVNWTHMKISLISRCCYPGKNE